MARSVGTNIPADSLYNNAAAQLKAARDSYYGNINATRQELNRSYADSMHQSQIQEPNRLRGLLNNFAGRGMAFSTGYGTSVGNENQAYQHMLQQLNSAHSTGLADLLRQHDDYQRQFHLQQAALRDAATARLAAQAGTLGLMPNPTSNAGSLASIVQGYYG